MAAEEEADPRKSDAIGTFTPASVDPAGEVGVRGEDGSEEAQEDESGAVLRRACSRGVGGGQKLLTQYKGAAEANPLNYALLSFGGEVEGG